MDYGMKVALEGNDVNMSDDEFMAYSTKYPAWKILTQGKFSINVADRGSWHSTTITGLPAGGIPKVWIEREITSDNFHILPLKWRRGAASGEIYGSYIKFDSTTMTIYYRQVWSGNPAVPSQIGIHNGFYYWMEDPS